FLCGLTGNASASTISQIESLAPGTVTTLDGHPIVSTILSKPGTYHGITYSNWNFLVQGEFDGFTSPSLAISGASPLPGGDTPQIGDALAVNGTYQPFDQIPEMGAITSISLNSTGNVLPPGTVPRLVTISEISVNPLSRTGLAGRPLELDNVILSGTGLPA